MTITSTDTTIILISGDAARAYAEKQIQIHNKLKPPKKNS